MTPEALRRRMAHGNIYRSEKVDAALANYFRVGNLGALRELALLWLADKVDAGLEGYRAEHGITQNWPTRERVVIALSGGPEGDTLLRRGARIASRGAGGQLLAVYVARTDGLATTPRSARSPSCAGSPRNSAASSTPSPATTPPRPCSTSPAGSTPPRSWSARPGCRRGGAGFSPSLAERIIADAGDIDVHVVTHPRPGRGFTPGRPSRCPAPGAGRPGRRRDCCRCS